MKLWVAKFNRELRDRLVVAEDKDYAFVVAQGICPPEAHVSEVNELHSDPERVYWVSFSTKDSRRACALMLDDAGVDLTSLWTMP